MNTKNKDNPHMGSSFESWLEEEGPEFKKAVEEGAKRKLKEWEEKYSLK